ncbi:hypothetical protein VTK56DRAFT_5960 [Thermocarpiscus australiensis]
MCRGDRFLYSCGHEEEWYKLCATYKARGRCAGVYYGQPLLISGVCANCEERARRARREAAGVGRRSKAGYSKELTPRSVLFQTDDEWYLLNQKRPDMRYPAFFNALDATYCHLSTLNQTGSCADPPPPRRGGYRGTMVYVARTRPTAVVSCLEVMKLALQGVTVVASSGDYVVGGSPRGEAGRMRRRGVWAREGSVGATALVHEEVDTGDGSDGQESRTFVEMAARRFASAGGFSNAFGRPTWQDRHIEAYLERAKMSELGYVNVAGLNYSDLGAAPGKLFDKVGGGYPDAAAVAQNYRVVLRGNPNRMHGMSIAVPIWASILT